MAPRETLTPVQSFIESGTIIQLVLLVLAAEAIALTLYWRRTGRGVAPRALLFNLAAGASFALALRATLLGHDWPWVAAWLAASLVFHVLDLFRRWHGGAPQAGARRPPSRD